MVLALVGSGEYLPPMEEVDRTLLERLPESPRVVCLPTAAGTEGAARIDYWSNLGVAHFIRLGAKVESLPVIDAVTATETRWADTIRQANFVYLSGGRPEHLHKSLAGTPVWSAILAVLDAGGVLAGCSAGAMVQGEKFFGFPGWRAGFNLWPGITVIPHYEEIPAPMLATVGLMRSKELTIVGVEGNTALVCEDGRYAVIGRGGVTIWTPKDKNRYVAGALPDGLL
ncbi:MAG: Type 1 glutamine amidotransferase-like domain-containing protein [Anaerolineales bacterium]|nr:Type 1 glutamine amidotransferase-like domain-containing protein [Anaerolineales bacterium]